MSAKEKVQQFVHFLRELKRRRVYGITAAYCVAAWLIVEVSSVMLDAFEAPGWVMRAVIIVVIAGLPVIIALAWLFDVTPEGVVRTSGVDESADEPGPVESEAEEPDQSELALLAAGGERRPITVLTCSLQLAGNDADPELLMELLPEFESRCEKVISMFEGNLHGDAGDEISAFFGYPKAHEDDAQRAIQAGLGIIEAINQLHSENSLGVDADVAVGVHSGLVVVQGSDNDEVRLVGDTPKLSRWLASQADGDHVLISDATWSLVEGYFVTEEPFECTPEGAAAPIEVHRVLRHSGARSRLEAQGVGDLEPMIGRDIEMNLLMDAWRSAVGGQGRIVHVVGDPGMGKTRILRALADEVAAQPGNWLTPLACSAYHQSSALYPVIDLIENVVLEFQPQDSAEERMRKLEGLMVQQPSPDETAIPLLASMLSIPADGYEPLDLPAAVQKQRTFEVLQSMLFARASAQPLLLTVEDLHWVDPTTLEFLTTIVDYGPLPSLLVVFTSRPGFASPWAGRSNVQMLSLSRFGAAEIERVIASVIGEKSVSEKFVKHVINEADGVPLFAEELTKAFLELGTFGDESSDVDPGKGLIPPTLEASLLGRLDNLDDVKPFAQLCAMLGRTFTYELLEAVTGLDSDSLDASLAKLVETEFLYQRGSKTRATYIFKHVLIQEVAYRSLLLSTRREYHGRIVDVLEESFPNTVDSQPELLAWHCEESGQPLASIRYRLKAAQRSIEQYANVEAIQQLEKAVSQVGALPESRERDEHELKLQAMLGAAHLARTGYATSGVEQAFRQALVLSERIGDASTMHKTIIGLWQLYVIRADFEHATELVQRLDEGSRDRGEPVLRIHALYAKGFTNYCTGRFEAAWQAYSDAIELFDEHGDFLSVSPLGTDSRMHVLSWATASLWHLGLFDQARQRADESISMARKLGHPYGLALSLVISCWGQQGRRETGDTIVRAEEAQKISSEKGLVFLDVASQFIIGWQQVLGVECDYVDKNGDRGIDLMQRSLTSFRKMGVVSLTAYMLTRLAQAYGMTGDHDTAMKLVEEGIAHSEQTGERVFDAEFFRLRGEIRRQVENNFEAARDDLNKAIAIARSQGSKALELRARTSLARMEFALCAPGEAGELLAGILDELNEGRDAYDVVEARTLLEQNSKAVG